MSSQDNKSVIQQIFAAAGEGDWKTVKSHMHEDMRIYEADSLPYSGAREGVDAVVEMIQEVFGYWEDQELEIKDFVAEGDTVVLLATMFGRGKSGLSFEMPVAGVWKLRDGKAIEVRPHYFDTKVMHDAHYGPST